MQAAPKLNEYRPRPYGGLPRTSYLSFSKLKTFEAGPEFFWAKYGQGREREQTQEQLDGQRLDLLLTSPAEYKRKVITLPFKDFRTFEARKWRDETMAKNPGSILVTETQAKQDLELQDSVLSHPEVAAIMGRVNYATCPETGLWYFIPDLLTLDDMIGDFKKVRSVNPDAFNAQQFFEKWYVQLSLYGYLNNRIKKIELTENLFYIAFEYEFPYRCRVFTLKRDYEIMGAQIWKTRAQKLRAYLELDPLVQNRQVWFQAGHEIVELLPEYKHVAYNEDFKNLPLGGV